MTACLGAREVHVRLSRTCFAIDQASPARSVIALLKNLKEPGAQIVVKWPEYVTSRILAVLYDEPYDMPRKSAAYAVFEAVRDGGVAAGLRRHSELVVGNDPAYHVDEDEFDRLTEVLPAMGEVVGR